MILSPDLYTRVRVLADREGLSVDAFVLRCVEDAVGSMEAAQPEPARYALTMSAWERLQRDE